MSKKRQLHSQIGACSHAGAQAEAVLDETRQVVKRDTAFIEIDKKYTPFEEEGQKRPDLEGHSPMTTTVHKRLQWLFKHLIVHVDAEATREGTNQVAKADITIGGVEYNLPATTLLMIEKYLKNKVLPILKKLPTNDANVRWTYDPQTSTWTADPTHKFITEKKTQFTPFTDSEGTPTIVEREEIQERTGTLTTFTRSGKVSSSQKARIIKACEDLMGRVIDARHKANCTEIEETKVGESIFEELIGDVFSNPS